MSTSLQPCQLVRFPTYRHMTHLLCCLQGTEDKVVPPNQAEVMYEALQEKGLSTALVMFEGEQHGFRQACGCIPPVSPRSDT